MNASASRPATAAPVDTVAAAPDASPSGRLVAAVFSFVILFAGLGYGLRGNLPGWAVSPDTPPPAAAAGGEGGQVDPAQFEKMVAGLAERLKSRPDDAQGWSMLGRSYGVLGQHDKAAQAYAHLVEIQPNDAQALADYADALATAQGRKLEGEPEKLIARALKADPDHPKALALAGTMAFNRNDFALAVRHWERAIRGVEAGSPLAQQLQGAADEARQRGGLPPSAAAPATAAPAAVAQAPAVPLSSAAAVAPGASLTVKVSLDAVLAAKVAPGDTVFVFARRPEGSRMPLAIQRRQVKDLPLELTLDDSMAMGPAQRLSSVPQVVVGARVSKAGDAMPKSGDLEGLSAPIAVGSTAPVAVKISSVVP